MMTTNAQNNSCGDERGYTLLGLLALATIIMIFATAAAPSIKQQAQREREEEAIFRGEQVAEAIRDYAKFSGKGQPNRMEDLQKGIPSGTKTKQILRPSAARDPLSSTGEWKVLMSSGDNRPMIEFASRLRTYGGSGTLPQTTDKGLEGLATTFSQLGFVGGDDKDVAAPNDEDTSANPTGPIIGVASRSRRQSIIYYYGVTRHDGWVFTPLFK